MSTQHTAELARIEATGEGWRQIAKELRDQRDTAQEVAQELTSELYGLRQQHETAMRTIVELVEARADIKNMTDYTDDLEKIIEHYSAILDAEPLWLQLARLAWAPVAYAKFVMGAARSGM